eukprot:CAMPEP_0118983196 /NCGR_PEP_ID=MMETSP1173-20130426/34749_1 /TAXON_ID=1034831 /ORGANISM="Rhizochromulina marina cf, Strain CCMP1243" /LENGTH=194 /DNA_ID=CAMNT_0006933751 /DNA_START=189 /DNA_END=770 /DNA_ORIENTATION=+
MDRQETREVWVSLVAGNTKLHWGLFVGSELESTWDTAHLPLGAGFDEVIALFPRRQLEFFTRRGPSVELWMGSVVPAQSALVRAIFPCSHEVRNTDVVRGLEGYHSFGVDRALALRGAGLLWGWPVLVIDGGTAMTFTVGVDDGHLYGGAIAPGMALQLGALATGTAKLPRIALDGLSPSLPRWAMSTQGAIES